MSLINEALEQLEKEYFDQIFYYLSYNNERMIEALESKESIKSDWWDRFTKISDQKQQSELARGAERIFYWLLTTLWMPNSAPIGSDLFFESYNAFIHIDVKTAKSDNDADFKGKVAFGKNQTSYNPDRIGGEPNLPQYYTLDNNTKKPCLTYILQIIHDAETYGIIAILLISIPNGQLHSIYGESIVGKGKNKKTWSMRYLYKNNFTFNTVNDKPHRIKFVYFNGGTLKSVIRDKKDITTHGEII